MYIVYSERTDKIVGIFQEQSNLESFIERHPTSYWVYIATDIPDAFTIGDMINPD